MKTRFTLLVISLLSHLVTLQAKPVEEEFSSALITGIETKRSPSEQLIVDLEKKLWTAYQERALKPYDQKIEKSLQGYRAAIEKQIVASDSLEVKLALQQECKQSSWELVDAGSGK